MTPDYTDFNKRAAEIAHIVRPIAERCREVHRMYAGDHPCGICIAAAISVAEAEMKERCARVADNAADVESTRDGKAIARNIAAAIRSLS